MCGRKHQFPSLLLFSFIYAGESSIAFNFCIYKPERKLTEKLWGGHEANCYRPTGSLNPGLHSHDFVSDDATVSQLWRCRKGFSRWFSSIHDLSATCLLSSGLMGVVTIFSFCTKNSLAVADTNDITICRWGFGVSSAKLLRRDTKQVLICLWRKVVENR